MYDNVPEESCKISAKKTKYITYCCRLSGTCLLTIWYIGRLWLWNFDSIHSNLMLLRLYLLIIETPIYVAWNRIITCCKLENIAMPQFIAWLNWHNITKMLVSKYLVGLREDSFHNLDWPIDNLIRIHS